MGEIKEVVNQIGFFGRFGADLHDQVDDLWYERSETLLPATFLFTSIESVVEMIKEERRFSDHTMLLFDETGLEYAKKIIAQVH